MLHSRRVIFGIFFRIFKKPFDRSFSIELWCQCKMQKCGFLRWHRVSIEKLLPNGLLKIWKNDPPKCTHTVMKLHEYSNVHTNKHNWAFVLRDSVSIMESVNSYIQFYWFPRNSERFFPKKFRQICRFFRKNGVSGKNLPGFGGGDQF